MTVNSTTLVWEYIHNDDNKVYDTLVLTKSDDTGSLEEGEAEVKDEDKDGGDDDDGKRDDGGQDDNDSPQMGMAPNELWKHHSTHYTHIIKVTLNQTQYSANHSFMSVIFHVHVLSI